LAKRLEREGKHVYHLELGEPKNYRGPKNYPPGRIINKTVTSLLNYDVGYTSPGGLPALRERLGAYISGKSGKNISADNVVISTANLLISQMLDIVCDRDDRVVLFTPAFPTYIAACMYVGAEVRYVPLPVENGFRLTRDKIDEAISHKPKVIFVNSGNNPTGAVYADTHLRYLVDRASKLGIWVISDETYGMLSYHRRYFSMLNRDYKRLVVISSFSKVFNIPGYRIGYAVGHSEVIRKIGLSTSTLYSCLPVFTQEGVLEGLSIIDDFAEERQLYYKKLCRECMNILNKSDYITCSKPESAFYLFIDIRGLQIADKAFCSALLDKYNTVVTPGTSFGCPGFIRASFCGNVDDVRNGLQNLVVFANALGDNLRGNRLRLA
jgi:aspartate/methionine/tyrosine aminotransferase